MVIVRIEFLSLSCSRGDFSPIACHMWMAGGSAERPHKDVILILVTIHEALKRLEYKLEWAFQSLFD